MILKKLFLYLKLITLLIVFSPLTSHGLEHYVTVKKGDSFVKIFRRLSVEEKDIAGMIDEVERLYNIAHLKEGQGIAIETYQEPSSSKRRLRKVNFNVSSDHEITVLQVADGFFMAEKMALYRPIRKPQLQQNKTIAALDGKPLKKQIKITRSLYQDASDAGVDGASIVKLTKLFSHSVDFQRDLRKGHKLTLLEERGSSRNNILYAELEMGRRNVKLYQFENDRRKSYFNEHGESIEKSLLRSPIQEARISSGYGMRRHPVLGYTKLHKGIDFAAPRGTPIYASGDGKIVEIGRKGSYGNYIRISHASSYSTAYAHLHRFAKGMRKNKHVRQGQLIGYVGSTGRSTGPHLHYEVLRAGKQINPKSVKSFAKGKLTGAKLAAFKKRVKQIESIAVADSGTYKIAKK